MSLGTRATKRARVALRSGLTQWRHGGPEAVASALMGQLRTNEQLALLVKLQAAWQECERKK
eukprot:14062884-Heterocapsa_arctica.AAC.1